MMPVPGAVATLSSPVPDSDELGGLVVADDMASTDSGMVGTAAIKPQELPKLSDSSAALAHSGAFPAELGDQSLSSVVDPNASAAQIFSESSTATAAIAGVSSRSAPGTSAFLGGTDTLSPNTAVVTPPLVAAADASSPSTPGTEASSSGINELSQSNAVLGPTPLPGSLPTVSSTDPTTAGVSRGTELIKTGVINAKAAVEGVQSGHNTKASSAVDHDGKHKTSSSTASTDSRGGGTIPVLATASSNNSSNRSDNQRVPALDVATAQQQNAAPNQSFPATSDSSSDVPGSQDLGSNAPSAATDAMASGTLTETVNVPAVSSAQLIQSIRHSEMRLGMQSDEFGSMSISTSLGRQSLSAQISTDHSELSRALAVHLPAMEQKLSTAYGVPVKVEVNSGTSSQSTSTDTSSAQQRQSERQQGRSTRSNGTVLPTSIMMPVTTSSYPADTVSNRLDIRV